MRRGGEAISHHPHALNVGSREMVERIRSLLASFPEDEETVRRLIATDARFDALCQEYGKVVDLLRRYQFEVERLKERKAFLEEELLARIEGYRPQ
jgi:hypothetical protein